MKIPRQILLEESQQYDSRLENLQREVSRRALVAQVSQPAVSPVCNRPSWSRTFWSELILPARRIWLSYAFIWIAIAAVHLATTDHTKPQLAKITNTSEAIAKWREQQIILTELTKPISHDPIDRPKQQPMSPRSEARTNAIG